jgi:hypothetical protein
LLRKLVMILGTVDAHPRGVAQVVLEISFAEPGVTFKHYVVLVNDLGFSGEVHWVSFLVSYRLQRGSDILAAVEAKSSGLSSPGFGVSFRTAERYPLLLGGIQCP